jgi:DNA-binding XRE family transcriptional regulator
MESEKRFFCVTLERLKIIMKEKESEKVKSSYTAILKNLSKTRAEAGLSQIDLALKLGLSKSGYFKIEKGKSKLDIQRLLSILYKLDISPKFFLKILNTCNQQVDLLSAK